MQPQDSTGFAPNTLIHNLYRIIRTIGRGGMGAVYEAVDQRLGATSITHHASRITHHASRIIDHISNYAHHHP